MIESTMIANLINTTIIIQILILVNTSTMTTNLGRNLMMCVEHVEKKVIGRRTAKSERPIIEMDSALCETPRK